jgi:Domain of unknown function (DUF4326)
MKPHRIQLRRSKGWKMPENTVKVDRTTKWGNPFIVGKHGDRIECVGMFDFMLTRGAVCASEDAQCLDAQRAYHKLDIRELRGKNLACWCKENDTCHADILIEIANA